MKQWMWSVVFGIRRVAADAAFPFLHHGQLQPEHGAQEHNYK
jgi:hypothetical protein